MFLLEDTLKGERGQEAVIYIEVDKSLAEHDPYARTRGAPKQVKAAFEGAMPLLRTCTEHIAVTVRTMPDTMRPDCFEVQFAIKIDTELGAVIARTSTEAQLKVCLIWGERQIEYRSSDQGESDLE